MSFLAEPWFWIVVTAASEIIGMSKLKDNSVLQLVFHALESLKPKKQTQAFLRGALAYAKCLSVGAPLPGLRIFFTAARSNAATSSYECSCRGPDVQPSVTLSCRLNLCRLFRLSSWD